MNEKQLAKIKKALGKDTVEEMDQMTEGELKKVVIEAEQSMKKAKTEMDENDNYQKAKNDKNLFETGLREVRKRQNARISYALVRIEEG